MKKTILLFMILLNINYAYSQKFELSLTGGIGSSINNFKSPTTENRLSHKEDRSLFSVPIYLGLNYHLIPNLYIGTGVGFSKYNYNQIMESKDVGYILEAVNFSESYLSIPLNIGFELEASDMMKVGVQYSLHYDIPLFKNKTIENSKEKKYGYIDYNYKLNQTLKSDINHSLSLYLKFSLSTSTKLIFELGYDMLINGTYGYELNQKIYFTDQNTQITTSNTYSYIIENETIDHNYFSLKLGLTKDLFMKGKD